MNQSIPIRAQRAVLTIWVRGNEARPEPTRKVRVSTDDLSPDGFSFRHTGFLAPGTTLLAYVPASPSSHLVETEVRDCIIDETEGGYRVAVAVTGRSNRLPLLIQSGRSDA